MPRGQAIWLVNSTLVFNSRKSPMISLQPVAFVHASRTEVRDDFWGGVVSEIELTPEQLADSFDGLEEFSHAEVIFLLDRVQPEDVVTGARHPRNNPAWPRVGIFAQRAKARPNRLGATIVRVVGRDGRRLRVMGLDAIDGSPVLDIKPVMNEFLPQEPVRQPEWSRELMRDYWKPEAQRSPGS
jgi:tRNA-Thr(GGU) m(6)t(6)A37 methyltransferase TsaA